jgi:uncharacterized protein (DUF1697 family)
MAVAVALVRGINVGGRHKLAMETLRELCEDQGARDVRTWLQSGNAVFHITEREMRRFGPRLATAIAERTGFRPAVMLRTAADLERAAAGCPFAGRSECDPAKLAVIFLSGEPGAAERARVAGLNCDSEEVQLGTSEVYVSFRNGMGRPKVTAADIEKAAGGPGTGRNWNTVQKLLQITREMA